MKTIKQTYQVDAPIASVWKALVDPEYIEGWGGGPAKISDKVGTSFKLWGGDIYGKNLEVVSEKSEILDIICDVFTISEKDSKRISMEYIGIFNEIFGKHESDIIHATGDTLQEVKDKIECPKPKTTTST